MRNTFFLQTNIISKAKVSCDAHFQFLSLFTLEYDFSFKPSRSFAACFHRGRILSAGIMEECGCVCTVYFTCELSFSPPKYVPKISPCQNTQKCLFVTIVCDHVNGVLAENCKGNYYPRRGAACGLVSRQDSRKAEVISESSPGPLLLSTGQSSAWT